MENENIDISRPLGLGRDLQMIRAKDIHMASVIDVAERVIYLTGALDTNDVRFNMEMELPDAGNWRVVKSETNLSDEEWTLWLIVMGDGMSLQKNGQLLSRQFDRTVHSDTGRSFMFYNGVVRPGEPVLKVMDIHTEFPGLSFSHSSRNPPKDPVEPLGANAAHDYMGSVTEYSLKKPVVDIRVATRLV